MRCIDFPDGIRKQIIVKTLKRGVLLVWKDFTFSDGTTRDKLVLILSKCVDDSYFVIALPTSKIDGYITGSRSFIDTVCFPKDSIPCFGKDTVIDLKNLQHVDAVKLSAVFGKQVNLSRIELPEEALSQVLEAVKAAKTLTVQEKNMILED